MARSERCSIPSPVWAVWLWSATTSDPSAGAPPGADTAGGARRPERVVVRSGRRVSGPRCQFLERNGGIRQPADVHRPAGPDQRLDRAGDIPHVGVHAGDNPPVGQPEGDELAVVRVATEHDAVPGAGIARVLHPQVVLVGEEVWDTVIGDAGAEHVAGRRRSLVEGVGPVLDPDPLAETGVPRRGHVTGGEDPGNA